MMTLLFMSLTFSCCFNSFCVVVVVVVVVVVIVGVLLRSTSGALALWAVMAHVLSSS